MPFLLKLGGYYVQLNFRRLWTRRYIADSSVAPHYHFGGNFQTDKITGNGFGMWRDERSTSMQGGIFLPVGIGGPATPSFTRCLLFMLTGSLAAAESTTTGGLSRFSSAAYRDASLMTVFRIQAK